MHIVYVKLEIVLSKSYVPPCSNRHCHSLGSWLCCCSKACTLLGWSSKSSCAYVTILPVQCMAKYMINCNITKVARCISLRRSPSYVITWVTMCKNLCYLTENTWKERQTQAVMQSCSLHRTFSSQYQALDVIASVTAPGARRMVGWSCLHTPARRLAHVSHDSGHAELVLGCMCTHFATLLLVSLVPLPS